MNPGPVKCFSWLRDPGRRLFTQSGSSIGRQARAIEDFAWPGRRLPVPVEIGQKWRNGKVFGEAAVVFEAEGVTRWPRIVRGRMVRFRERWVFPPDEWPNDGIQAQHAHSGGSGTGEVEYFLEVARWRRRHGLPRHVFAHTTGEPKPRYLDLESPLFVEHLRRITGALHAPTDPAPGGEGSLPPAAPSSLTITEMLPGPEELWISDREGGYASEFLVQLEGP